MSKENSILFNDAVMSYDHTAFVADEYECRALVK